MVRDAMRIDRTRRARLVCPIRLIALESAGGGSVQRDQPDRVARAADAPVLSVRSGDAL